MQVTTTFDAPCPAEELYDAVADLGRYPEWLDIVTQAVPADTDIGTDTAGADPGPAWHVDLRGRLGPMARSKRLRMVRTAADRPRHLRLERRETDGRHHSPWVLDAQVDEAGAGSRLTMTLHYGGTFGGSLLERMLANAIEQSRPRLLARVANPERPPAG